MEQSEPQGFYGGEGITAELVTEPCSGSPAVVFLRGEIDIANAYELRRLLDDAIRDRPTVLIDLTDVTFIDGAVLGVIAHANARVDQGLHVRGASGLVARVFHLCDMGHLLEVGEPALQSQSPTGASPGL